MNSRIILLLISASILAIANVIIPARGVKQTSPAKISVPDSMRVTAATQDVFAEYNIRPKWQRQRKDFLEIFIPEKFAFLNLYSTLDKKLANGGYKIVSCREDLKTRRYEMIVGNPRKFTQKLVFVLRSSLSEIAGYAAIIIDDFGYRYDTTARNFLSFSRPLTISIIPGLTETQKIRRDAVLAHKEILVHMPMEPLEEKFQDDGYIILSNMKPFEIRLRLEKAFAEIPEAVGLNNHQGSRATIDEKLMKSVLGEVKSRNKIFIDSRTNSESIAQNVAKIMGLKSGANQIFLDAQDEKPFIASQMLRLGELASQNGAVIGIAHVRENTWHVLSEMVPELEARGIEFVFVSQALGDKRPLSD